MRPTHTLIVGGGPAGASAALALAQAGLPHLLLERTATTVDSLCGGFLSWRSLEQLERFDIAGPDLNRGAVTRLLLTWRGRSADAPLPRPARCVSRLTLDRLLLDRAAAAGARIERGVTVRGWADRVVHTGDGAILSTDALFLATGKHDLRGLARPAAARGRDPAIGLRVRLAPAPGLDQLVGDRIELHLFDRGYCGAARQEDGAVNLCLAVRRSRLTEAGSPATLLAALAGESPHLRDRLAYLDPAAPITAIANVPYGWRAQAMERGVFRLGDQAAVIPSLAGEGMGIALASGALAARVFRDAGSDGAFFYATALSRMVARPVAVAGMIRAAAERGWSASALLAAVRLAPGLAEFAAHLTRIKL